ncbi:hypothetical protein BJY01DRAFT_211534 [Aspergillus pseudoustus]|uniref:Uncharacterized protein n=1 Tax=Aspergillus pseudoustus TaxID=1810923 RepID=A0ABR4KB54_9EURO
MVPALQGCSSVNASLGAAEAAKGDCAYASARDSTEYQSGVQFSQSVLRQMQVKQVRGLALDPVILWGISK